ncbi:MAG: hypothetical protein QOD74_952 [Variibacter sp.]|nr:hypothetical protein [Variibacter sp.]
MQQIGDQSGPHTFNYDAEAELFCGRTSKSKRGHVGYKRFARAADAIKFVVEDLSPEILNRACLEVDEVRYQGGELSRLYESAEYQTAQAAQALRG